MKSAFGPAMTCAELQDCLDDLVDGSLDDRASPHTKATRARAHLAACPACYHDRNELVGLVQRARSLPHERPMASDLWPRLADRLVPARSSDRGRFAAFAAAAGLVLFFVSMSARLPSQAGLPSHGGSSLSETGAAGSGGIAQAFHAVGSSGGSGGSTGNARGASGNAASLR